MLGAAMWLGVQRSLYHAIDDALLDRAIGIERFIEDHKTRLDREEVKEEFRAHGELFQVFDADGALVHRGAALESAAVPLTVAGGDRFENVTIGGEPLRFASHTIDVDGRPFSIQVAAPLHDVQEGLRESAWFEFRNDVVTGPGGCQILIVDPSGNLVELFEPGRP